MIHGTEFWNKKGKYFSQTNNPTEAFLKAAMGNLKSWLESCGPTAAVNCLAAMGKNVEIECPGTYKPQPEEVLMDYFNDPRNSQKLKEIRDLPDDIPENRVPQFYPQAVYDVFQQRCIFRWGPSFESVADHVSNGRAVQLCLKKPGHYIAIIAYDDGEKELIFNDPWGERFKDGKSGRHRRLIQNEFLTNVQPYYILYQ